MSPDARAARRAALGRLARLVGAPGRRAGRGAPAGLWDLAGPLAASNPRVSAAVDEAEFLRAHEPGSLALRLGTAACAADILAEIDAQALAALADALGTDPRAVAAEAPRRSGSRWAEVAPGDPTRRGQALAARIRKLGADAVAARRAALPAPLAVLTAPPGDVPHG